MKEFGLFELDGKLPTLDENTADAEKFTSNEAINQSLGPIRKNEYDGFNLFNWGKTEDEEGQLQTTGDAKPEIGQDGEPISNSVQYAEHFREPYVRDQRFGTDVQAIRINRNNATDPTNTTGSDL